jgi:hypothetical protein
VIVVFRRESVHKWSPIDKFRLRLLLTNAVLPLALCTIGLLLLSVEPEPLGIWRWCSGVAFVVLLPFGIERLKVFRRFNSQQLQSAGATRAVFYVSSTLEIGATLLQLYNAVFLGTFWPFFTGIVVQLIAAMFQFARIILVPPE